MTKKKIIKKDTVGGGSKRKTTVVLPIKCIQLDIYFRTLYTRQLHTYPVQIFFKL